MSLGLPHRPSLLTACRALKLAIISLALSCPGAYAQITLDGSLGASGTLSGPNFLIPSSVGQTRGSNLFHSFGKFNVLTGESATFTGPSTIHNILGRVTGGEQSKIDGLVRSDIAGANLYLINPAGVMFGPNASLDVKGSFHISTADYLKFADGAKFYANLARDSVLTTAPVSAFGFLSSTPAPISAQGLLAVPQGQNLSMVGGDISLVQNTMRAPGGSMILGSVASAGEAMINAAGQPADLNVSSFERLGNIQMGGANLTVSSPSGAGAIVIRGGNLIVNQSVLNANTTGSLSGAPAAIDVDVQGNALLTNGGQLLVFTSGAGNSGAIKVDAANLTIENGASIFSGTFSSGSSGDTSIKTGSLEVLNGGFIISRSLGPRNGGNINVEASRVAITNSSDNFTGIFAQSFSTGGAGNVKVATDALQITGINAQIGTPTFGPGRGGNLDITAKDIFMSGSSANPFNTGIFASASSTGNAGNLNIVADNITGTDHARAQALSFGSGDSGNMTVRTGTLELTNGSSMGTSSVFGFGKAGTFDVTAKNITISGISNSSDPFNTDFTGFGTSTRVGQGGDLRVTTDNLQISNRGFIISSTAGPGTSGNIDVVVSGDLKLTERGQINSATTGSGNAGNIKLTVGGEFSASQGGVVLSATFGSGAGGSIDITANSVSVGGPGQFLGKADAGISGISSQSGLNGGKAGSIRIRSGSLEVTDGGVITADTFGAGKGGDIEINADRVMVSGVNAALREALIQAGADETAGASTISSSSSRVDAKDNVTGDAGNIKITAPILDIDSGGQIFAETHTSGKGGSIAVATNQLTLKNGASISAKSFGTGIAGNIDIAASDFLRMVQGSITTQADSADGGNIHLRVGNQIELVNSQITAAVGNGNGSGGNITIDPTFVTLNNSEVSANAFGGPGGNITIVADVFLASSDSVVSASSVLNTAGVINIDAPETNLSGAIAPLPETVLQATSLLSQSCAARFASGKVSSLVVGSRDGLPLEPGGLMPSPLYRSEAQVIPKAGGISDRQAIQLAANPLFSIDSPCAKP